MFEWTVPGKKNHSASWYTIAGILTLSLAIWGIISGIYALTFVVVIMAGVYILLENNAPETARAIVNQNGVGVGEVFYDFGQVAGFSIVFDHEVPRYVRVSLKKNNLRTIDIPVSGLSDAGYEIGELRTFLPQYLAE